MKCKFITCLLSLAVFFVSCAKPNANNNQTESLTLPAVAFKEAIQKPGVQILDVRTAGEYAGGHIQNALQANWTDQKEFQDRTQHLDKKTTVYVYCQAGGRSAAAQTYLIEQGYKVVNLEGGMSNWKMNGLPVEGNANAVQMRVDDFDKVISSHDLILVDIGATWCPPCRKMLPTIDKIKVTQGEKLYFLAVDGGVDMDVMKKVQFEVLPTFIIYKKGKEVWRKTGIVEEAEFNKVFAN